MSQLRSNDLDLDRMTLTHDLRLDNTKICLRTKNEVKALKS